MLSEAESNLKTVTNTLCKAKREYELQRGNMNPETSTVKANRPGKTFTYNNPEGSERNASSNLSVIVAERYLAKAELHIQRCQTQLGPKSSKQA